MDIIAKLAEEFSVSPKRIENTIYLIDQGNTIPFIARYRKEMTGSLDDQVLRQIFERLNYLRNLDAQREKILAAIGEQGKMTPELEAALQAAATLTELEDLYRPYRPKRKTRASVARAKGLQGLADLLYAQAPDADPCAAAAGYLNDEVATVEDALAGAQDIVAEMISDDPAGRKRIRYSCKMNGSLVSEKAQEDAGVYEMYASYSEPVRKIAAHRVLAVNRGEKEGFLKAGISYDRESGLAILRQLHLKGGPCAAYVDAAIEDAYTRLIFPSIERDLRSEITENADENAIRVFADNTRQLLMQPPVKGKVTIGLDPGYRTGCKVAVVDASGEVLDTAVIYCAPPHIIKDLVHKYHVQMFAIGNGTASHETEVFAAEVIRELYRGIVYMVVSEAGASVYSASKLAAEEFPQYDVSLRSAVSIARRLQDPLAELVKIDPKAIGVGQYQHDMPQKQLNEALDGVVEDCVNSVGVDLNTASVPLLSRVAGISQSVAKNIVAFRRENGGFTSRAQLKKVSKLGPKAFEQCAGFLRVRESKNVLDNTAVHPESYAVAEKLLALCGVSEQEVRTGKTAAVGQVVKTMGASAIAKRLDVGEPTLKDIVSELQKPGRDPRDELPQPMLRTDILGIEDLKPGMELKGTVRNVVDFGAFVDIGVHQDGLVHISQITSRYIRHPSDVLKVGDIVTVWVLQVDAAKKRISLTMKKPQ